MLPIEANGSSAVGSEKSGVGRGVADLFQFETQTPRGLFGQSASWRGPAVSCRSECHERPFSTVSTGLTAGLRSKLIEPQFVGGSGEAFWLGGIVFQFILEKILKAEAIYHIWT